MTNESFIKVNNKLVLVNGHPITINGSSSNLQENKAVTITENGTATITPDEGYDGLSSVDVTVDVSGGGGVETCTLIIEGIFPYDGFIAYTSFFMGRITPVIEYFTEGSAIQSSVPNNIFKNSSCFIGGISGDYVAEGSIVAGETGQDGYYSFLVTGDCKITF